MKKYLLVIVLALAGCLPASAQFLNFRYVAEYDGADVGAKMTNAAASCPTDTSVNCALLLEPMLAGFTEGMLPTLASHISVIDLRSPGAALVPDLAGVIIVDGVKFLTIQAAITSAGSNATVIVPPRATPYLQTGPILIADRANFHLVVMEGATIKADAGFATAGHPLIAITGTLGTCDNVSITGKGVLDSNLVAGEAVQIGGDCTGNYYIEGIEVKNSRTNEGVDPPESNPLIAVNVAAKVRISGLYGHTATDHPVIRAQGGSSLWVSGSLLTDAKIGVSCVSTAYCSVKDNDIADMTDDGISSFGSDYIEWEGNRLARVSTVTGEGVHSDNGIGGCARNNRIVESPLRGNIFLEVSSNVCAEDNYLDTSGSVIVGNPANGSRQLVFTNNVLDVVEDLVNGTGVDTLTVSKDFQEGEGSIQAVVQEGFTTGPIFYDPSIGTALNFQNPWHDIWIKSDVQIRAGVLQFGLSPSEDFSNITLTIDFPHIPADTWVHVGELSKLWGANYASNQPRSWGIVAAFDPGAATLKFDNYQTSMKLIGNRAEGNTVINSVGPCFLFGILTGGVIADNECKDPAWVTGGGRRVAYKAVNSQGVRFTDNSATFTTKSARNTGVFLDVDAASTVQESGSQSTGHDTLFRIARGGEVHSLFKSSVMTFDNEADTVINLDFAGGSTTDQIVDFNFRDRTNTTLQHRIRIDPTRGFIFRDHVNGVDRLRIAPAGNTVIRADDSGVIRLRGETGRIWTDLSATSLNAIVGLQIGNGTEMKKVQSVSGVSIDPASIATATRGTATGRLQGCAVGDFVEPVSLPAIDDDLIFIKAECSAPDTVRVYLYNPTGRAIDDRSYDWTFLWIDLT